MLFDVTAAAITCAIGLLDVWLLTGPLADIYAKLGQPMGFSPALAYLGILGMTLPLTGRRVFPVTTLFVVTAAFTVIGLQRVPEWIATSIALLVVIYSVGAYAPRWTQRSRVAALSVIAAITVYQLAKADYGAIPELDSSEVALFALFNNSTAVGVSVISFAIAWILGDAVRRSRQRQAELATRSAELAAANEIIARQAVADERLRIARELHDVVAHHVSVMGLQAGAARRVLDHDREAAVRALRIVEDTGRRAVDELQRLLGMLREDARGDDADGGPQPTMGDLVGLVERMRDNGLDVRVRTTGAPPELPAGVELSVYRVVQEALTNALKHAGSTARVDVELEYAPEELRLTVRSRATAGAALRRTGSTNNTTAIGRGLIGMQERVGMHGGRLRTQPLAGGGFEVLATIPV